MFSFSQELVDLTERYPEYLNPDHTDHMDWHMLAAKILEKDGWVQEAKRQVFVAEVKKGMNTLASEAKRDVLKTVAVTISPEQADIEICQEIVERLKKISAIQKMSYVYEQRSENPEEPPRGWHIHAYVHTTYSPSHIKTYIAQVTYKKKKQPLNASVKCTPADTRWLDNYMRGDKHNEGKDAAVQADRIYRERLGLKNIYEYDRNGVATV